MAKKREPEFFTSTGKNRDTYDYGTDLSRAVKSGTDKAKKIASESKANKDREELAKTRLNTGTTKSYSDAYRNTKKNDGKGSGFEARPPYGHYADDVTEIRDMQEPYAKYQQPDTKSIRAEKKVNDYYNKKTQKKAMGKAWEDAGKGKNLAEQRFAASHEGNRNTPRKQALDNAYSQTVYDRAVMENKKKLNDIKHTDAMINDNMLSDFEDSIVNYKDGTPQTDSHKALEKKIYSKWQRDEDARADRSKKKRK